MDRLTGAPRTVADLLILDACVLIDLVEVDETVLSTMVRHLGPVHVAAQVLAEVDTLDEARAIDLGVHVIEPSLELLARASTGRARLSFQFEHLNLRSKVPEPRPWDVSCALSVRVP